MYVLDLRNIPAYLHILLRPYHFSALYFCIKVDAIEDVKDTRQKEFSNRIFPWHFFTQNIGSSLPIAIIFQVYLFLALFLNARFSTLKTTHLGLRYRRRCEGLLASPYLYVLSFSVITLPLWLLPFHHSPGASFSVALFEI